jgi:hypothetical protein
MSKQILGQWSFGNGYASSVPRLSLLSILAHGTLNAILTGLGFIRNFGGLDKITPHGKGSSVFFQTDNTFAGLGDESEQGRGSVLKVQRVLAFTGLGQLRYAGDDIADVSADSTLQYIKKTDSVFTGPGYPAGQARPSSQTIYPKTTPGAGKQGMSGTVATVIWRIDSTTGQVSLASLASNVLSLEGQTVIQPFPAVDTAQDYWGIGVCKTGFGTAPIFYELKTDLGGEVAESTLAYSRNITQASITNGTNVLTLNGTTPVDKRFSVADVGRRAVIAGKLDSWITDVTDAFNAITNEDATDDAADEPLTVTHAIEGILRSVEISWTTESLAGQELAPFDAYPPPSNLIAAGLLNDAMFVETDEGIIYVGVVGFIGSYPPKNTLFPAEPAILYLDASDGLYYRFSKNRFQALVYVGGSKPIELQTIWNNIGILYPQNAAIGAGGRVIAWSGKPVRMGAGSEPDIGFAFKVYKDFAGWTAQTAEKPVIAAYDPDNQFDCWAYDSKIMMCRGGSNDWCSPVDVSSYLAVGEYLMSAVIVDNKLRWCTNAGTSLFLYRHDEGSGSTMTIQTTEYSSAQESDTITQFDAVVHVDDTDSIVVSIIKNFVDSVPVAVKTFALAASPENQQISTRTNTTNAKQHSVRLVIDGDGKDVGVQSITTYGESSGIYIG